MKNTMAVALLRSLFPRQVSAPLADVFMSLLEMQLRPPRPLSESISSGIQSRRLEASGPESIQNWRSVEMITCTTVLWFETTQSALCTACQQRRAVSRRSVLARPCHVCLCIALFLSGVSPAGPLGQSASFLKVGAESTSVPRTHSRGTCSSDFMSCYTLQLFCLFFSCSRRGDA